MVLNTEIEGKRRTIDTIRKDISHLDVEIEMLMTQLEQLQDQLNERKANYVKSMRYMHRNRSVQSQMMFIFSADNLVQMFRRMRFMREYANYQRAQGEEVKEKQEEDDRKKKLLQELKGKENVTLDGTGVNIYANIGGVGSIGSVLANDAGGIGLFRSEFLYLESDDYLKSACAAELDQGLDALYDFIKPEL